MDDQNKNQNNAFDLEDDIQDDDIGGGLSFDTGFSNDEDNLDEVSTMTELPEIQEEEEDFEEEDFEEEDEEEDSSVVVSKTKIILAKQLLKNIAENNEKLISLFDGLISTKEEERINISQISESILEQEDDGPNKIIEGVFDGENMIGPDGKQYSVPHSWIVRER